MPDVLSAKAQCAFCQAQDEFFAPGVERSQESDDAARARVFHEPCQQCDKVSSSSFAHLCSSCRHLRIQHLMFCIPSMYPEYLGEDGTPTILMPFLDETNNQCDFCSFVNSCAKSRNASIIFTAYGPAESYRILESRIRLTLLQPYILQGEAPCTQDEDDLPPDAFRQFYLHAWMPDHAIGKISEYIDWQWLRAWGTDNWKVSIPAGEQSALQHDLRQVNIIDLVDHCVVKLPRYAEYVALSYVWGSEVMTHCQALEENINSLRNPGGLDAVQPIPKTVFDAMTACKELGYRYLWVNRLCIVQDSAQDVKNNQLTQMADIYRQARLTFAAMEGDNSNHGLAGVGCSRTGDQLALKFSDDFEVVEGIIGLQWAMLRSTWHSRGWTFQEYMAASSLLCFTNLGLYLIRGTGKNATDIAEGPIDPSDHHTRDKPGLDMLGKYSSKVLTWPRDRLYACAGLLNSMYGERTSFGIPWDKFDQAILWTPLRIVNAEKQYSLDLSCFPSWSWAAHPWETSFFYPSEEMFRVAYWWRPVVDQSQPHTTVRWVPLEIPKNTQKLHGDTSGATNCLGALAWLAGCVHSAVPSDLLLNCSVDEYTARLETRWPQGSYSYWHDAFQSYKDISLAGAAETDYYDPKKCLIVHTHKSAFTLDWKALPAKNNSDIDISSQLRRKHTLLLRLRDQRLAGYIILEGKAFQQIMDKGQKECTFITLSLFSGLSLKEHFDDTSESTDFSMFVGCPCATGHHVRGTSDHLSECPKHENFHDESFIPKSEQEIWYEGKRPSKYRDLVLAKYLESISYLDYNGHPLPSQAMAPCLNVMMIVPGLKQSIGSNTYERLGVGRVYLKRWTESSPSFETIVLV